MGSNGTWVSVAGRALLVAVVLAGHGLALHGSDRVAAASDDAAPADGPSSSTSRIDARKLIEAADLADSATLDAVDAIRFTEAGTQAAADVLASSDDADALWAAIWVYASGGQDPEPLLRHADSSDSTNAAMAAATLVAFGDRTGFTTLERSLASEEPLRGAHPPLTIGDLAMATLARYVPSIGEDSPIVDEAGPAEAAARWAAWLSDKGGRLTFDEPSGTWVLP